MCRFDPSVGFAFFCGPDCLYLSLVTEEPSIYECEGNKANSSPLQEDQPKACGSVMSSTSLEGGVSLISVQRRSPVTESSGERPTDAPAWSYTH